MAARISVVVVGADIAAVQLAIEPDIDVVANVNDGRAALAALLAHAPQVFVIGEAGRWPELADISRRNHPGTAVVTVLAPPSDLAAAIRSAARSP